MYRFERFVSRAQQHRKDPCIHTMEIQIFNTKEEIARVCADQYAALLQRKSNPVLGFATGASPIPTYKELIRRCHEERLSFRDAVTFNLDEYCELPREDKNSYYTFMHENFFSHIDIREENIHLLDGNAPDLAAQAEAYEEAIAAAGGIDLQLLGIGTNGHIGFNEPADCFTKKTFVVELTQSTVNSNKIYFDNGAMPTHAITMGIGSIFSARQIILIATGSKKANAIRMTVNGDITPRCPASILQFHPNTLLLLDTEAAALL